MGCALLRRHIAGKRLAAGIFSLFSGTATHARSENILPNGPAPTRYPKQELTMPEPSHPLVQLAGSERAPLADVTSAGQLDTSERAELTLVLRRRAEIPADIVEGPTVLTSDQLAEQYGADPADVDLVRQPLTGLGLEITAVYPASRRIKVAGRSEERRVGKEWSSRGARYQ